MNLLFIHHNFPGQWQHLAAAAIQNGHRVVALAERGNVDRARCPAGVTVATYSLPDVPRPSHRLLHETAAAVRRGQTVARAVAALNRRGFSPDVIAAHSGWGESLYLKDVLPDVPVLAYMEFYYRSKGADAGFDPEFPVSPEHALAVRTANATNLLSLDSCDGALTATRWQHSLYPEPWQPKIKVIHDGIDTVRAAPDPAARFALGGRVLTAADEVVTFVARNLEPYRGFHVFMRALPDLLKRRPKAHVVIVGGDRVSYGAPPASRTSWRAAMLKEVAGGLDPARVHFCGRIPYPRYLALLQVSRAHVYLTYPFVLSWSVLEAMSAGCLVVGSDTPPVREVIEPGRNGLLVDFFSRDQLVAAVDRALAGGSEIAAMRTRARRTVIARYDVRVCVGARGALVDALARARPRAAA